MKTPTATTPTITDQQVARSIKASVKFLRENPELLEACRSNMAARDALKVLRQSIRAAKAKAAK
jgi:hypothetical protein